MKNTKAIIIDDEKPARELIKYYLKDHKFVSLVGEAENGFEGAKKINTIQPELVFLDIQMPKINGFEMLELLDFQPKIIFCTAFDEYAIKAFEANALDYLLKPFSKERFIEAINKIQMESKQPSIKDAMLLPVEYYKPLERIVVKERKEITIIDTDKISYLEAQDDYVEIHTLDGKWLKQQTMKYFESALDKTMFVRVHRKYILSLNELAKLDKLGKESYMAVLRSGETIPVSTSGYKRLKEQLDL